MVRANEFGQPVGEPVTWSGARPPEPVELSGRLVRLVPFADRYVAPLHALREHRELWTYLADDLSDVAAVAAATRALREQPDTAPYAILDAATGDFLGRSCYLRVQPAVGSIEVGSIVYAPRLQRTAAATEAQYLLLRHAFDELGYRRYEWKCDSLNAPSRRAALRLGFVEEGTWRNALVYKGRNRDTTWFSITDAEWPRVKDALERWLDPANVDDAGRQRRRLEDLRAG